MVNQLVVAAEGIGSRMSISLNSHKSKALIEYKSKPLVSYLLNWAKEAGITEYFISVNEYNKSKIERIADSMELDYETKLTGDCFAQVPCLFKGDLDYKFLVMCGHDPVPSSYIKSMINKSHNFDAVTTAYSNKENSNVNKRRIRAYDVGSPEERFEAVDLSEGNVPEDHIYVRNPYIINLDIIDEVVKHNFERTARYYIHKLWESGGKVTTVKAITPVEFDYDCEFERTKLFLDSYFDNK